MLKKIYIIFILILIFLYSMEAFKRGEKGKYKKLAEQKNQPKLKKELKIEILSKPDNCEKKAQSGEVVTINYIGLLEDGTIFDSSEKNGRPLIFPIGSGKVIPGMERGIQGMCVGEKRKLVVPSDLAYGDSGALPTIPEKATLIFEIELLRVQTIEEAYEEYQRYMQYQQQQQQQQQQQFDENEED
jgi:FK506-binding protein 2